MDANRPARCASCAHMERTRLRHFGWCARWVKYVRVRAVNCEQYINAATLAAKSRRRHG